MLISLSVSPAETEFTFGTLTRASEGGIAKPAGATSITGGTATGYTLTAGFVEPTSNGSADAGTIIFDDGTTWTITTVASTYTVSTATEFNTLCRNLTDTTIGTGLAIELRPGYYQNRSFNWNSDVNFNNVVVVRPADTSNRPQLSWLQLVGGAAPANITLENLDFVDDYTDNAGFTTNEWLLEIYNDNVIVDRCTFDWGISPWVDGGTNYQNDGQNTYDGIHASAGTITIKDCTAENIRTFAWIRDSNITVQRCVVTRSHGDFCIINPVPSSAVDTDNVNILDNVFYNWAGNYNSGWHSDFIQSYDANSSTGNITNVTVERNVVFPGPLHDFEPPVLDNSVQFMLLQNLADNTVNFYDGWVIRGNLAICETTHGVTFEQQVKNTSIIGNTFVNPRELNGIRSGTTPQIDTRGTPGASGTTGIVIAQNICGSVIPTDSADISVSNNLEVSFNSATLANYTAIFAGTTFTPATKAEALVEFAFKPNGSADLDASNSLTSGDAGAVGTTAANGIGDFTNEAINTALIA